ncbi:MAG: SET domain-containing protein-lysine N-methyltransferase, partial [Candidatus Azambacteria bacterium]|nr:SET domain-containing protein-lysine N-methyltransferase [Candidatus Azambacteria bacterium]
RDTGKYGLGVFAIENIKKGEIVADSSDGTIYEAGKCSKLSKEVEDHAMQFEEGKWIDAKENGRYINHSCEPNCGIKDKFKIVAMRDINKGEEINIDYEMTEDSDWKMECNCGSSICRGIIGAHKNMPKSVRQKYGKYISDWLIEKYKKQN